mmetsp:Transcript_25187/g.59436  ORF Transcript_25187/g.59436 Transcript_25187/m.59436 type:complete len:109 (+) Transcript_25187:251-577(+)|eukprot:CAMPEP_0175807786 /NCGR_PEP_ID=MMETSP0107_2-20121207/1908_1 /TAXON_ID=195067 ORGANISM="Goniomonas pacifica, Strain CCMP1869" /NCGR_SAMPLE_ID=MMETSP0107_2 /ASSEMBLY_ACC=CAM_ASM_000203 /LENGTH=108 /DNA_ID=CAMNT_0017119363 /DNA_START=262 /DNA_END=588 /DNA_ORIENTATION=-
MAGYLAVSCEAKERGAAQQRHCTAGVLSSAEQLSNADQAILTAIAQVTAVPEVAETARGAGRFCAALARVRNEVAVVGSMVCALAVAQADAFATIVEGLQNQPHLIGS